MEIIYINDNKEEFLKRWKEYIDNNIVYSRYIPLYIEYILLYAKHLINNKSFIVIENNSCVGICFLPIEQYENKISVSVSGGYVISPLSTSKRIEKVIFKEIAEISKELNIQKVNFYLSPMILEYKNKFNYLLEYNFIDTSTTNCLIDLKLEQNNLWKNLRKSYKALINSVLKNNEYEILIINNKTPNSNEIHGEYKILHEKCAGVTRGTETFDKQFEMLQRGFASIIGLKYKDKFIGISYFLHFKNTVVYMSGTDDPKYENSKIPIYHVILWSAILYFKENNFDYFELSRPCGYNKINGFEDYLDEKQINISHFKRGMGTKMVPVFRGVKYYDNNLLIEDIDIYKNKVLEN